MSNTTEKQARDFSVLYDKVGEIRPASDSRDWRWRDYRDRMEQNYSPEQIERVLSSGSLIDKIRLSRSFFNKGGFYRSIVLYYATLLKFMGMVIPNDLTRKGLKSKEMHKSYYKVLDYADSNNFQGLCWDWAVKTLRDGTYYGVVGQKNDKKFTVIDLPISYCDSNYKDYDGKDMIRFNLAYFDTFNETERKEIFKCYPKYFKKYYNLYSRKNGSSHIFIPSNNAIYFSLFGQTPFFLGTIPAVMQYDDSLEIEREKELEEIRKIIVQKVPHLNEGQLLFEPVEAKSIHDGTVKMLSKNKNVSVLTTYTDVDAIISKTSNDNHTSIVEKMTNNVYANSGVSGQLFSLAGGQTIKASINKDMALMMVLANQFSAVLTNALNDIFGNKKINFKYNILPITHQNEKDFIDNAYKMVSMGYSFIVPALAMGMNQKDLVNVKDLENNALKLHEKLIPLQSAYQTNGKDTGEVGRQEKEGEEKAPQTVKNDESKENQGGSN